MLSLQQRKFYFVLCCWSLAYLVDPERRARKMSGMESFPESACFHRLRDLSWPSEHAQMAPFLTPEQSAALSEFEQVYHSLPWCVLADHPHISALPDDDLSPLMPAGKRLFELMHPEAQSHRAPRAPNWFRRVFGLPRDRGAAKD